jgi:hypothetical protein
VLPKGYTLGIVLSWSVAGPGGVYHPYYVDTTFDTNIQAIGDRSPWVSNTLPKPGDSRVRFKKIKLKRLSPGYSLARQVTPWPVPPLPPTRGLQRMTVTAGRHLARATYPFNVRLQQSH